MLNASASSEGGPSAPPATGDVVYDATAINNVYDKWGVGATPTYATPIPRHSRGSNGAGAGGGTTAPNDAQVEYSQYNAVLQVGHDDIVYAVPSEA